MAGDRYTLVHLEGVEYQIPTYWLIGRRQARERERDEDPRTALHGAIADWAQQVRLEGWKR